MKIGILGSGLMGGKLGTLFAQAGHAVIFSYSRSPAKLESLAQKAGSGAESGTPREAVRSSDVLLLAVNWSQLDDVLSQAGDLSGKTVISCSLPLNASNSELIIGRTSSGVESLAQRFPHAKFVLAFNSIPSEVLFDVYRSRKHGEEPSMMYCGDDSGAKRTTGKLIQDLGFEPFDMGALAMARNLEPFSHLIAHIAYEGERSARVAYRFEWMDK
jgi:predicted dinucleotide-binding enzyme